MAESQRFAVLLVSLWFDSDGTPRLRITARRDEDGAEATRIVSTMPELLETVAGWATPFLKAPKADEPLQR